MPAHPNTPENVWRHVFPDPNSGCWLWAGAPTTSGYGRVKLGSVIRSAHRYFYEVANGPIPAGLSVLHSCDTPLCVNPSHLRAGTPTENQRDCTVRGRRRPQGGERNPNSKLSDAETGAIRRALADGALQREIAARYGVSPSLVSKIKHSHCRPVANDAS